MLAKVDETIIPKKIQKKNVGKTWKNIVYYSIVWWILKIVQNEKIVSGTCREAITR